MFGPAAIIGYASLLTQPRQVCLCPPTNRKCPRATPRDMQFPLGKPILVMTLLSLLGAAALVTRNKTAPGADLEVWAFGQSEITAWRTLADAYHARTGKSVDVQEVSTRAIDTRL